MRSFDFFLQQEDGLTVMRPEDYFLEEINLMMPHGATMREDERKSRNDRCRHLQVGGHDVVLRLVFRPKRHEFWSAHRAPAHPIARALARWLAQFGYCPLGSIYELDPTRRFSGTRTYDVGKKLPSGWWIVGEVDRYHC